MATYKGIQGFTIQNLSADPSNPIEGQVWYNSTSNVWKVEEATTAGAWATGNNMNTAREVVGAGTQTAGLAFGGSIPPTTGATEEYDGTSWTNNPTGLNTARQSLGGAGTQTAALAFGGYPGVGTANTGATEEYDGSTWTSNPTGLNTARTEIAGAGTQTAALGFGGGTPAGAPYVVATEEYDGSTWTTSPGSLATGRTGLAGAGTQTAGLAFGGYLGAPGNSDATEEYDGATWTAGGNLTVATYRLAGCGTQTAGLGFGGDGPPSRTTTQLYDGTSWANNPTGLNTGRLYLGGIGTQPSALAFGGQTGGTPTAATEEWTGAGAPLTQTITVS
jgi:hypothetical protein